MESPVSLRLDFFSFITPQYYLREAHFMHLSTCIYGVYVRQGPRHTGFRFIC